ncbi:hypothetical protein K2173_008714 [Erythroxylum novogranatense]|uniref:peptidylprolyl isomerase n=1 Tax=Erythroxylum novogranatense TaxID=1862640 RepID=A0AAV8SLT1_9ROSI|nr:hypothetical protein K2173_008714 [Erythroxylum novogranatense]
MGFWGIEVKPGKPHPYHSDNVQGTLYVTQATLGLGSTKERTVLQCSVGHKIPIFLCSLLPDKIESCSLNLEFKDELVAFSVIGSRSVHLSGYFVSDEGDHLRDEYDPDSGEDIAETDTDTDQSSEYDYDDGFDDGDDFIVDEDDDFEVFPPSPVPKSGVVIEEIMDDDKPANENGKPKQHEKRNKSSVHEDQDDTRRQIVVNMESEDEDGFPICTGQKSETMIQESVLEQGEHKVKGPAKESKKKTSNDSDEAAGKKRKVENDDQDHQKERKKKKKKKQKEKRKEANSLLMNDDDTINQLPNNEIQPGELNKRDSARAGENGQSSHVVNDDGEKSSDKKKKKNKKKKKAHDIGECKSGDQTAISVGGEAKSSLKPEDKQFAAKSSKVRTFANGLIIEELAMGKPDGKRASPGSQVSVCYIGKLRKNGEIFDSNVGRAPFKFRLGVGQVIKGWDVGVNGMRVGDKRRLTIPPSMGYGSEGAGKKIPPNSWLVFDVELVNVR